MSPGQAYAVNLCETFVKEWLPAGEQVIIRVDRAALEDQARWLSGEGLDRPLTFAGTVVADATAALLPLTSFMQGVGVASERFRRQLQELPMSTILMTLPNSCSALLARTPEPCAPFYVRRVEEAIAASPFTELSIQDLARISGVSVRALYYGFRQFRDTTPAAYVKNKRLEIAWQKLLEADPRHATVTGIAAEYGFFHLAKFAASFKKRFGRIRPRCSDTSSSQQRVKCAYRQSAAP